MKNPTQQDAVTGWIGIPGLLRQAIGGLSEGELELRGEREGMSIRETVHHLAEANIVAASIMIAAIGKNGCTYDWSWLYPDRAWVGRMGYETAPVEPALNIINALCTQIANLVTVNPEILTREVHLFDAPGEEIYSMTVADIMRQEIDHAAEHLSDIRKIRSL